MNDLYEWLFGRVLELDMRGPGPPWPMRVFNPDTGRYERIGGAGGGGEPLVLDGADPPDFLATEEGDVLMVEDNRG